MDWGWHWTGSVNEEKENDTDSSVGRIGLRSESMEFGPGVARFLLLLFVKSRQCPELTLGTRNGQIQKHVEYLYNIGLVPLPRASSFRLPFGQQ
jgi:hypothetical protein